MAVISNRMRQYDRLSALHRVAPQGPKPRQYPTERYKVELSLFEVNMIRRALWHEQRRMNQGDGRYNCVVDDCLKIFENLI